MCRICLLEQQVSAHLLFGRPVRVEESSQTILVACSSQFGISSSLPRLLLSSSSENMVKMFFLQSWYRSWRLCVFPVWLSAVFPACLMVEPSRVTHSDAASDPRLESQLISVSWDGSQLFGHRCITKLWKTDSSPFLFILDSLTRAELPDFILFVLFLLSFGSQPAFPCLFMNKWTVELIL